MEELGGNQFPDATGVGYFEGSAYNNRFTNPIILDGNLYYTEPVAFTGSNAGKTYCVDIRTGQTVWSSTKSLPYHSATYTTLEPQSTWHLPTNPIHSKLCLKLLTHSRVIHSST